MIIKVLQLNIQGGRKIDEVIRYIKEHQFDLVHLQEVNGGSFSRCGADNFNTLKQETNMHGELAISMRMKNDKDSYYGNATFYKPSFVLDSSHILWMKEYKEYTTFDHGNIQMIKELPRNALVTTFPLAGKKIVFVNTHLAWGPNPFDEPYKVEQGKILYEYLSDLKDPFVLSGDFNVTPDSEVLQLLNTLGSNHIANHKVTNTLNPNLHRAKELFPQGLAVDYILTSPFLTAQSFNIVDRPDLSDHYGLKLEIEV